MILSFSAFLDPRLSLAGMTEGNKGLLLELMKMRYLALSNFGVRD